MCGDEEGVGAVREVTSDFLVYKTRRAEVSDVLLFSAEGLSGQTKLS